MPERKKGIEWIPRALATGNKNKAREFEQILAQLLSETGVNINIEAQPIPNLPEFQSTWIYEVAGPKAVAAYNHSGKPVLVEDTGLYIPHYKNSYPGALYKFLEQGPGNEGLLKMMEKLVGDERIAIATTIIAYHDGQRTYMFKGELPGVIAQEERGKNGFGYDTILEVDGRTLAEMTPGEKNAISMRRLSLQALVEGNLMDVQ